MKHFLPIEIQHGRNDLEDLWLLIGLSDNVADYQVFDKVLVHFSGIIVCMGTQLSLGLFQEFLTELYFLLNSK